MPKLPFEALPAKAQQTLHDLLDLYLAEATIKPRGWSDEEIKSAMIRMIEVGDMGLRVEADKWEFYVRDDAELPPDWDA